MHQDKVKNLNNKSIDSQKKRNRSKPESFQIETSSKYQSNSASTMSKSIKSANPSKFGLNNQNLENLNLSKESEISGGQHE